MPALNLLLLALLIAIAVGVAAVILAWRERSEPGAVPLTAMLVGQIWWSVFLVLDLTATTLDQKVLWSDVRWVGVVIIPVAWLLFALEYTGRDEFVRPRYVALLSTIPAITVLLALTGEHNELLYVDSTLVEQGGRLIIDRTPGPWYWVIAGYTYLFGVLGAIPLLRLVSSDALPFRGQSTALLVGIVTPWAINALFLAGAIPIPGLDPTPIGFAISGVAYLGAINRFRLFGTNPAPSQNARRLVFEGMQEGAVVIDNHDYIVDVNESASEIFGVPSEEILGRPAGEVIPDYEVLPEEGAAPDHLTIPDENGNRFYDGTVTRVTDVHGRTIGRVLILHDVGKHLRQQQRLAVLNRVLRHNIRTETNIISGFADLMAEDDESVGGLVKEHTARIEEMAEKARNISEIFEHEDDRAGAVSLDAALEDCVASFVETAPDVDVDYEPPARDVRVDDVLEPVFSNVVENAVEHNTNPEPRIVIRAEVDGETARVVVEDNGPGIDEAEQAVLSGGAETPLQHGSGLGLWLIKWGVGIADGRVTFEENTPTGTIVTVEIPTVSRSEAREDQSAELSNQAA